MPAEFYDEDGFRLSFESDTNPDERQYFMRAFPNVSKIAERKIHCTTCNTHIGTAPVSEAIIRMHPVLRVTHCRSCHAFYNSGEFDKGEDGSELYCRWCGQGGEVFCCSKCPYVFCKSCIVRNLSRACVQDIVRNENWHCFSCSPRIMWHLRAQHWALANYIEKQKKEIKNQQLTGSSISALMKQDRTNCCPGKGVNRFKSTTPTQPTTPSATKKATKRSYGEVGDQRNDSIDDVNKLEPIVSIPPLPQALIGAVKGDLQPEVPKAAKAGTSSATPSVSSSSSTGKPGGVAKKKQKSVSIDESTQSTTTARAPQAKKKRNNEVVCTPDIMSMLSNDTPASGTVSQRPPIVAVGTKALIPIAPKPSPSYVEQTGVSPMLQPVNNSSVITAKMNVAKQRAILHHTIPRNMAMNVPPNQELTQQTVRVSSTVSRQSGASQPLYHSFDGYQVDLHAASQQSTYRLPNGKLILVRKQVTDVNAPNAQVVGAVAGEQQQHQPQLGPMPPTNVMPISNAIPTNRVLHNNNMALQPQPPQQTMIIRNGQDQVLRRVPQAQVQKQQVLHQQQRAQLNLQHQTQARDQFQQQFQRTQQRAPGPRTPSQRMVQQLQHQLLLQQQQQQELQQQLPPQQGISPPVRVAQSGVIYLANNAPTVVPAQTAGQISTAAPPGASNNAQPAVLTALRAMVNGPHEDTPLGNARKDFEAKMLAGAEICHHILSKIYSLTNSNPFKNIRNLRDLKELFIHLSYLMTYGIGRFKTLHERCVDDVKKMGFTKESDFVMMGERINNRNPEDDNSEDDDDCEIIEQNTTVIEVDSDEEAAAAAAAVAGATPEKEIAANGDSPGLAKKSNQPEVSKPTAASTSDGNSNTLTVGDIVVTWKVTEVNENTSAQTEQTESRDVQDAVAGEVAASLKKTVSTTGAESNENNATLAGEKDKSVEGTAQITKDLSADDETTKAMKATDASNPATNATAGGEHVANKPTATQTRK
uniref:PHD-type domain-containing protein n=1 Tax=Anopheles epiroticus TaxID=199890 RepID=A0A182P6W6_9DIPT